MKNIILLLIALVGIGITTLYLMVAERGGEKYPQITLNDLQMGVGGNGLVVDSVMVNGAKTQFIVTGSDVELLEWLMRGPLYFEGQYHDQVTKEDHVNEMLIYLRHNGRSRFYPFIYKRMAVPDKGIVTVNVSWMVSSESDSKVELTLFYLSKVVDPNVLKLTEL